MFITVSNHLMNFYKIMTKNAKKLSSINKKKDRTAVVIIHGIGEQRPVNTLRDFVKNVKSNESDMWEKPDIINGNFETRKITSRLKNNSDIIFDFYEYYWAHNMRGTKLSHMLPWLRKIILRYPTNISERLKTVYFTVWSLIGLSLLFFILNLFFGWLVPFKDFLGIIGAIFPILLPVIMSFFLDYLGDAAVYLDPNPNNISERNKIREEGIKLVQGLHTSGEYNRIVLIGHSLGSVIAYDIVKFLWNQFYNTYTEKALGDYFKKGEKKNNEEAEKILLASKVFEKKEDGVKNLCMKCEKQNSIIYQIAQNEAYKYIKTFGNEWLITDLVTIGSPLAHAKHLFTDSESDLKELINLRDYPVCPPYTAKPFKSFVMGAKVDISSETLAQTDGNPNKVALRKSEKVYYYSHSSPFAVTKWTNFYFSNDIVGGPLSNHFGKGILDVEIKNKGGWGLFPAGHTKYWDKNYKFQITKKILDILNFSNSLD